MKVKWYNKGHFEKEIEKESEKEFDKLDVIDYFQVYSKWRSRKMPSWFFDPMFEPSKNTNNSTPCQD